MNSRCMRCGRGERWMTGIWCKACIEKTCCIPRRGRCVHGMPGRVGLGRR